MSIETERMILEPLRRTVIEHRLAAAEFTLEGVHYPASWPGDALVMFAKHLVTLGGGDALPRSFTAITKDTRVAVGQLGAVGRPDERGVQEIGYGFNPEVWGRGLASEAVAAMARSLLAEPDIANVGAMTAVANVASERVLEKSGFARVGSSHNDEDGELTVWELRP